MDNSVQFIEFIELDENLFTLKKMETLNNLQSCFTFSKAGGAARQIASKVMNSQKNGIFAFVIQFLHD